MSWRIQQRRVVDLQPATPCEPQQKSGFTSPLWSVLDLVGLLDECPNSVRHGYSQTCQEGLSPFILADLPARHKISDSLGDAAA